MKTKVLMIAMLLTAATFGLAAANEAPRTGMALVAVKGTEIIKVIYRGASVGKVKLNIVDKDGDVILSETIRGLDGFIYPLNFKGLAPGAYTVELTNALGKLHQTVVYEPPVTGKDIHVSRLKEPGKYLLTIRNSSKDVVQVNIFDNHDKLVFTGSNEITGDFALVYNIQMPGAYTFEVVDSAGNKRAFSF